MSPTEVESSDARARERHRRIALTAVSSLAARIVTIGVMLVSVPLAFGYLGEERYGLWLTITSFTSLLAFADLGLGNGILNAVSRADGRADEAAVRRYVSSGVAALVAIAAVMGLMFVISYPFVPWPGVFNVTSEAARSDAGPAVAAYALCFVLGIPLALVERVRLAFQEGFLNNLAVGAGSLLGLGGLLLAIGLGLSLPWLVLLVVSAPLLTGAVNGALLFFRGRSSVRPALSSVSRGAGLELARLGGMFFVLQVMGALAYYSDNIVIAQVLGAEEVAGYAIPFRLFALAPLLMGFVLTPLWPAYSEALGRGDGEWVRTTFTRSLLASLGVGVLAAVTLVLLGRPLIELWVGSEVVPSVELLVGFGAWVIVSSVSGAVAMFLNGAHVIRFQVVTAILTGFAALFGKIFLARSVGVEGVIWATVVAQLVFIGIPTALYLPRVFRGLTTEGPEERSGSQCP